MGKKSPSTERRTGRRSCEVLGLDWLLSDSAPVHVSAILRRDLSLGNFIDLQRVRQRHPGNAADPLADESLSGGWMQSGTEVTLALTGIPEMFIEMHQVTI